MSADFTARLDEVLTDLVTTEPAEAAEDTPAEQSEETEQATSWRSPSAPTCADSRRRQLLPAPNPYPTAVNPNV